MLNSPAQQGVLSSDASPFAQLMACLGDGASPDGPHPLFPTPARTPDDTGSTAAADALTQSALLAAMAGLVAAMSPPQPVPIPSLPDNLRSAAVFLSPDDASARLEPTLFGSAVDAAPKTAGEPNAPPSAAAPVHAAVAEPSADLPALSDLETPMTPSPRGGRQPIPAAEVLTAIPQENAPSDDRHAATTRSTRTSPGSQDAAFSELSKAAFGEKRDAARYMRHASPDAERATGVTAAVLTRSDASNTEHRAPNPEHPTPHADPERARVVEQVTQKIETLRLSHGRQEITLHLHPEHLGELRLTVVADRESVTARIVADTPFVRQAMEESREHLRAALEQKGFTLQGLDVALNQGGGERRFAPFLPETGSPSPRGSHPTADAAAEPAPVSAMLRAPGRQNGRLDYQA